MLLEREASLYMCYEIHCSRNKGQLVGPPPRIPDRHARPSIKSLLWEVRGTGTWRRCRRRCGEVRGTEKGRKKQADQEQGGAEGWGERGRERGEG